MREIALETRINRICCLFRKPSTGSSEWKGTEFGEGSSVRANCLGIGCPKLVDLLFCLALPGSFTSLTMFGNHFFGPCYMTNKLLDCAPLRFAPQSTVLPAWLAPLAAKRLVASLPHNATGHTWSHLVTPGHSWSQMVTNTYRVVVNEQ